MDNELAKRVSKLKETVKDLKTNQVIGGDSWVMYRTKIVIPMTPLATFQVDFIPDTEGRFVNRAYKVSAGDEAYSSYSEPLDPDPNYDGRWYVTNDFVDVSVEQGIMFYTTKPGRIIARQIKPSVTA